MTPLLIATAALALGLGTVLHDSAAPFAGDGRTATARALTTAGHAAFVAAIALTFIALFDIVLGVLAT